AYIIAGHHAGLPDGKASLVRESAPGWTLDEWRKEGEKDLAAIGDAAQAIRERLPDTSLLRPPPFLSGSSEHTAQALPFWIRMLFSCLVDADCLDAEAVSNPDVAARRGSGATVAELLARMNDRLAAFPVPEPGTVNSIRAEVLAACRKAARQPPGVYSLTAPTGVGKTFSVMAFALEHAVKYNKRRVIHVIPYTSIIEQTAGDFIAIFGSENVCEHHSGVADRKSDSDEPTASRLAADNWDALIVVTTSVQFFESLYASRGSKCRKLHNLADSVIVLDEAQLIPVALLEPCVEALRQLVHGYGVTLVLSTATQPALPKLAAAEIIPDPRDLFSRLKRTRFVWPKTAEDTVSWADLAARLRTHDSFLCIVNTRRNARDLWLEVGEDAFHLSTLMCPQHRRNVLDKIRRRLATGEPTKVVSTQLVEAGVNIDFPVVYRALAGMDSLAQAAGRCNREGKKPGVAEVHVFIPEKGNPAGLIAKGASIVSEYLRNSDTARFESPDIFSDYFHRLFHLANDKGDQFLEDLSREARSGLFPFRTMARRFRMIDEDTSPVVVPYRGGEELMERIRRHGLDWKTLREAQRFIVSPPRRIAEKLEREGRIEEIADGFYALTRIGRYDDHGVGLDVWDGDISAETFIV
ncbi:MAG: CRISPR-associated helicase Cas3', partial [Planctomycetota bacterium]|nr:CRISPR-associated helicase Cas3' [Planctomycetota bacterium]